MTTTVPAQGAREAHPFTFTTSDGAQLRALEDGTPEAPLTVVLVHGWTMDSTLWNRVVAELVRENPGAARILRFDLRGHGGSDPAPRGGATVQRCADDLAELITHEIPDGHVVLAGHSMGGMAAMALAERHPDLVAERITALALVATSSGGLAEPSYRLPRPAARALNLVERKVLRPVLTAAPGARISPFSRFLEPTMRWLVFGGDPERADVARSARLFANCHPASTAGYRASLAEHERTGALAAFRGIPVVLLAGLRDRLCPKPRADLIARELPDAEYYLYPGAGHMLPWERTTEVARRLNSLVRSAAR
jgi:pimeloyl-ACP methyl ester carboxylesterase